MGKQREPLPGWLAEIEARLRNGGATFGAKTVLELLAALKAQRKVIEHATERWDDAGHTTIRGRV